jgi:hypothetical protein
MTEVDLDDLQIAFDGEVPIFRLGGALYSGRVNESRKGRLASTFHVLNGYKDGEELIFGESGSLEGKLHYAAGVVSGKAQYFRADGSLQEEATFELGVCLSSTVYDAQGAVQSRFDLAKDSFEYRQLERLRASVRHR